MSVILSEGEVLEAQKHWKVLENKFETSLPNDEEVKKCIGVINATIFRNGTTDIAVDTVTNEDFINIMNEIDSEIKSNEKESDDNDSLNRHKDTQRMTFITAPVSATKLTGCYFVYPCVIHCTCTLQMFCFGHCFWLVFGCLHVIYAIL